MQQELQQEMQREQIPRVIKVNLVSLLLTKTVFVSVLGLSSSTQIFVPVVVTAALLALIGFAFVIHRYSRIKKRRRQRVLRANAGVDSYNTPAIALGHFTQISRDSWEISPENLVLLEKLGEGFFGVVYKGELAKPVPTIRGIRTLRKIVACKMLKRKV